MVEDRGLNGSAQMMGRGGWAAVQVATVLSVLPLLSRLLLGPWIGGLTIVVADALGSTAVGYVVRNWRAGALL